jgi:hypothetical protein
MKYVCWKVNRLKILLEPKLLLSWLALMYLEHSSMGMESEYWCKGLESKKNNDDQQEATSRILRMVTHHRIS